MGPLVRCHSRVPTSTRVQCNDTCSQEATLLPGLTREQGGFLSRLSFSLVLKATDREVTSMQAAGLLPELARK